MKLHAFSIRDAKTEVYNTPFFAKTNGEAERNFDRLVKDSSSQVHLYPEDYDLWLIGSYDDNTGTLEPLKTPVHIAKAISYSNAETLGPA